MAACFPFQSSLLQQINLPGTPDLVVVTDIRNTTAKNISNSELQFSEVLTSIQLGVCKTIFQYTLKLSLIPKVWIWKEVQRTPRLAAGWLGHLLERNIIVCRRHLVAKGGRFGMPAVSVPSACSSYKQSSLLCSVGSTSLKFRYLQARTHWVGLDPYGSVPT